MFSPQNLRLCAILLTLSGPVVAAAEPPAVAPDPIIATFAGGEVRASELAREIAYLPRDEQVYRKVKGFADEVSRRDWMRRIALRRIAVRIAEQEGWAQDAELRERARAAARRFALDSWQQRCYGFPLVVPSDAELTASLAGQEAHLPLRLKLSHIFLRAESEAERAAAIAQLSSWRSEITTLEQFQDLAARRSDSQSAHRRGKLGWIHEGWLAPEGWQVLATLAPGTMSPPLVLHGGVHLFFVEARRPPEIIPATRKLPRLRAEKVAQAQADCRARRLAASPSPGDPAEPRTEQLQIGDWQVPTALVEQLYAREDQPLAAVRRLYVEDEVLFQAALGSDALSSEERLRLLDLSGNVWLSALIERRTAGLLSELTDEELKEAFASAPEHYRRQRHLQGRYLKTRPPAGQDPLRFLDDLTLLAQELGRGERTWDEVAALMAAEQHSWPLLPQSEVVGVLGPLVFDLIQHLGPGAVSPPIQDGAEFYVVGIEVEEPARSLTLAEATPQLRQDFAREQRKITKAQVAGQLLADAQFQLVEAPSP